MTKSVGIVTRTKNRAVLLRRAIESVANQSYDNWVHVIVNDGGDVESVEKLLKPYKENFSERIKVIHNPQSVGMEAASNLGLALLDTEYAVIHDDDDSWSPEFLTRMMGVLQQEQKALPSIQGIICYSNRVIETVTGNLVTIEFTDPFNHWIPAGLVSLDRMLYENMFPPISFIFSLNVCREIGGFNEQLPVLGDWDFHVKFMLKHDIWVLPEPMAFYHHRPTADGVMGNSVIAGLDKHRLYRSLLTNQWLRDDLNGIGNGLGTYCAQREHLETLLRHQGDSLETGGARSIDAKLDWILHSVSPIEKIFRLLRNSGVTPGMKKVWRKLKSWK